jgi:chloramphenicol 3-O-phosphotransferase
MPAPEKQAVIAPDMLARVGRALYGENWKMPLARDLAMSDRSLHYMATGERGIHAGIVADLLKIIETRQAEAHEIAKDLRKALRSI